MLIICICIYAYDECVDTATLSHNLAACAVFRQFCHWKDLMTSVVHLPGKQPVWNAPSLSIFLWGADVSAISTANKTSTEKVKALWKNNISSLYSAFDLICFFLLSPLYITTIIVTFLTFCAKFFFSVTVCVLRITLPELTTILYVLKVHNLKEMTGMYYSSFTMHVHFCLTF